MPSPTLRATTSTSKSTAASTSDTVAGAVSAGANVIVAGSALYRDPEGLEHAVTELRAAAESARLEQQPQP